MIFKKPYAFLIKYFKIINLFLSALLIMLAVKINSLHNVINQIYLNKFSNYSILNSKYLDLTYFFLIFSSSIIIVLILLLFRKKKKPINNYLFGIIYLIILLIFSLSVSSVFNKLQTTIVEISDLNLYSNISFLINIPLIYFIIRYLLIGIGFDLKKFDFKNDILEIKKEINDDEEVEIDFNKNNYKYKRFIFKTFRELKYYYLENKLYINIILGAVIIIFGIIIVTSLFGKSNYVKVNKTFVASSITYKVNNAYDVIYDKNGNEISPGYKFVLVNIDVLSNNENFKTINYDNIRLFYGNEYVYSTNYYKNRFTNFKIYNNQNLTNNFDNYYLIFKVPDTYKNKKYILKFYNGLSYEKDDVKSNYIFVKITSQDYK